MKAPDHFRERSVYGEDYDMDEEDDEEIEGLDTLTAALEQIDDALDAIADVIE